MIVPLSGYGSSTGSGIVDGVQFAAERVNKWGGINGKKIRIIVRDSESDPETARRIFIDTEKTSPPLVYMTCLSSHAIPLIAEAEKNKAPLFCLVTGAQDVTKNKEYSFRYWPTATDYARGFSAILEKTGKESPAIFYVDDAYGKSMYKEIEQEFGERLHSYPYDVATTDFDAVINTVVDYEVIIVIAQSSHCQGIFKSLRKKNYSGMLIVNSSVLDSHRTRTLAIDSFFASAPLIYNENYQFNKKIKTLFNKQHSQSFSIFAALGYDMSSILFDVLQAEKSTREDIKAYFDHGFVYNGIFGNVNINPGDHDFNFELYPVKINGNKILYEW